MRNLNFKGCNQKSPLLPYSCKSKTVNLIGFLKIMWNLNYRNVLEIL